MDDIIEFINNNFTMSSGLCMRLILDILLYIITEVPDPLKETAIDKLFAEFDFTPSEKNYVLEHLYL